MPAVDLRGTARRLFRSGLAEVLARPVLRAALNVAFLSLPAVAQRRFVQAAWRVPARCRFDWVVRLDGRRVAMPIEPELPQSWGMALGCLTAEPGLYRFYDERLRQAPPRLMFDVGANHGMHALRFLAAGVRCVLFEPQPECHRYVRALAARNSFRLELETCVLSDAPGEATLYTSQMTWYSSLDRAHVERFEPAEAQPVAKETLDRYCAARGLAPDLVKIDVETHELAVLRGAEQLLTTNRPTLVIEVFQAARLEVYAHLAARGYRAFEVQPDRLRAIPSAEEMTRAKSYDFVFEPR